MKIWKTARVAALPALRLLRSYEIRKGDYSDRMTRKGPSLQVHYRLVALSSIVFFLLQCSPYRNISGLKSFAVFSNNYNYWTSYNRMALCSASQSLSNLNLHPFDLRIAQSVGAPFPAAKLSPINLSTNRIRSFLIAIAISYFPLTEAQSRLTDVPKTASELLSGA